MTKTYIIENWRVSGTTYQFIHDYLTGCSCEEKRFFLHLLCSHLLDLAPGEDAIVPGYDTLGVSLPSITIKAEFHRSFSWKGLEEKKLIDVSDFFWDPSGRRGECRYYLVKDHILRDVLAHLEQQVLQPDGLPAVNLFDGTAYHVKGSVWSDPHGPTSTLMRRAVKVLHGGQCPINVDAIHQHLTTLKAATDPAYQNDRLCAQTILAGVAHPKGIAHYTPSYLPQATGRIGERGGGVQSCTKRMKQAAFSLVPNIHNYDLRKAHGYVLVQELTLAGIEGSWVEAQLDAFDENAAHVGVPAKLFKKCFFATINGASHLWKKKNPGAIQSDLLEHFKEPLTSRAAFRKVVAHLKPLKKLVRQWRKWLLLPECPYRRETRNRDYILNAAGQPLHLNDPELKRRIIAHILQGQEASYIHHLTMISKKHGFIPVSNQHDGLLTIGLVPEAAMDEAGQLSGLKQHYLEIKPFV